MSYKGGNEMEEFEDPSKSNREWVFGSFKNEQNETDLKRLKEMCIYIGMSIMEKVFKYEATELPVIKYEDEIWFKAVAVATILKYTNQRKAIRDHVDPKDKRKL